MFQTNTAREIFYIFLWLAGIILLYALVHTFILEPSHGDNTSTHTKHAVVSTTSVNNSQITNNSNTQSHVATVTAAKMKTMAVPEDHQVKQPLEKIVDPSITQIETKKESTSNTVPVTPKVSSEIKISSKPMKKEITATEKTAKNTNIKPELPKTLQAISTPSVPKAVNVPKGKITIPTIPDIPTLTTKKVEVTEVSTVKEVTTEDEETTAGQMKELKKVLNRDEEMKLIETARQHVIDSAEAARSKVMEGLDR